MNDKQRTGTSKFLSLVLRHEPQKIGLRLDPSGWVEVEQLLNGCESHGMALTRADLEEIVATNEKKRFSFSEDGLNIRASQGHSVEVELGYESAVPPAELYHGTATRSLDPIRREGLNKGARHHVHLSSDLATACKVGQRHGKVVVLTIRSEEMHRAGYSFYLSENGVWLTDHVPSKHIEFPPMPIHSVPGSQSRSSRARLAEETVAICESGIYNASAGHTVDLRDDIIHAKTNTVLYSPETVPQPVSAHKGKTLIEITDQSTFQALQRLSATSPDHLACLNFASAKNPGGGFLGGSQAQEEALSRSSALYPCLLTQPDYYERNRAHRSALYLDLAIFSPRVPFFRDDEGCLLDTPVHASVITAPAPNAGAITANEPAKIPEILPVLSRRAAMVLDIAIAQKVTHLILGAWGCGVFRNDAAAVADCFARLLRDDRYAGAFEKVVFAVLDRTSDQATLLAFRCAFPRS